jgi:hypothetical protein
MGLSTSIISAIIDGAKTIGVSSIDLFITAH